jgi:hypothetical protein
MKRKLTPIIIAVCTAMLGASAAFAKNYNFSGGKDDAGLGFTEVPELQGLGGVALLTMVGSVGYGARRIYQKIVGRNRQ